MNYTMQKDSYGEILDGLDAATIDRYDREESGAGEYEQGGGAYTFGALCRSDQIAIMRALGENLPTRTARPNASTGTSYALKHIVERYTGFYVSNLQTKTAMRVLGYARSADELNPVYNVTKREWRAFSDLSAEVAGKRGRARAAMSRRREERACAKWFNRVAV